VLKEAHGVSRPHGRHFRLRQGKTERRGEKWWAWGKQGEVFLSDTRHADEEHAEKTRRRGAQTGEGGDTTLPPVANQAHRAQRGK